MDRHRAVGHPDVGRLRVRGPQPGADGEPAVLRRVWHADRQRQRQRRSGGALSRGQDAQVAQAGAQAPALGVRGGQRVHVPAALGQHGLRVEDRPQPTGGAGDGGEGEGVRRRLRLALLRAQPQQELFAAGAPGEAQLDGDPALGVHGAVRARRLGLRLLRAFVRLMGAVRLVRLVGRVAHRCPFRTVRSVVRATANAVSLTAWPLLTSRRPNETPRRRVRRPRLASSRLVNSSSATSTTGTGS